jgi:hypothetical protein
MQPIPSGKTGARLLKKLATAILSKVSQAAMADACISGMARTGRIAMGAQSDLASTSSTINDMQQCIPDA